MFGLDLISQPFYLLADGAGVQVGFKLFFDFGGFSSFVGPLRAATFQEFSVTEIQAMMSGFIVVDSLKVFQ